MPDAWKARVAGRATIAIAVLVVALISLLAWSYRRRATEAVRLAVVPFEAGPGTGTAAFALSQSIAHRLALIHGVTVQTVPAGLPGSRDSAHAIARALGVRYLVVGSVDRSPTADAPDRVTVDARLIDTEDSPPAIGEIISTLATDLCPASALIALDIAGHFARAPHGHLWGPNSTTGCAPPKLLERRDDPGA